MSNLDQWTLDLLTNDDVLAVDQDPLGKAAIVKTRSGMTEVWARPLFDNTQAVALFNKSDSKAEVSINWSELGISGSQQVRDLWQRKELGSFDGVFKTQVLPHCAVMVKIGKPAE
jgi:alpha-galactosidase